MARAMAFPGDRGLIPDDSFNFETCSIGRCTSAGNDKSSRPASRSRSQMGSRCGTSSGRPASGASVGVNQKGLLPLRADVLLSNTLFEELDNGISPQFLRRMTGNDDLEEVDFLEMQVDTVSGSQTVEGLGELVPNLKQLRLNQSAVCSIRDLGTTCANLRVLWLRRSALQDLGGITAMPVLEELYISFNDVRDLSPLLMHDSLQVLDVEGNLIEDFDDIANLRSVRTLRELTLSSNPVCKSESFSRERVFEVLPDLEVLDDVMRGEDLTEGGRVTVTDLDDVDADADFLDTDAAFAGLEDLMDPVASSGSDKGSQSIGEMRRISSLAELDEMAEDTEHSEAVAELRKAQAQLRSPSGTSNQIQETSFCEPSEQELIVENVKRARRPVLRHWSLEKSLPAEGKRPCTSFIPDRRGLHSAWSNSGSSTTYRPTSATSGSVSSSAFAGHLSSASHSENADPNSSDLTTGDSGTALAGNALSAIRRRRNAAKERGEDAHSIRDLLRRFDTYAQESCLTLAELELRRRQSENKGRPATSDVRVSAPRLLTASGRPAPFPNSLPGAPGESWVTGAKNRADRPGSRKCGDFMDHSFAPTFTTEAGEALIID